jgi:hypothetical protein
VFLQVTEAREPLLVDFKMRVLHRATMSPHATALPREWLVRFLFESRQDAGVRKPSGWLRFEAAWKAALQSRQDG